MTIKRELERAPAFLSMSITSIKKRPRKEVLWMGEDGFEPSKHEATDLQSAPFGHSGTPPHAYV